mmetsp:Transcript_26035/g.58945  ORF Transcript_26035/g.58945 Transcript_26035/m.58945 type:complete len:84 (-) Transcript_26035:56-307(-)
MPRKRLFTGSKTCRHSVELSKTKPQEDKTSCDFKAPRSISKEGRKQKCNLGRVFQTEIKVGGAGLLLGQTETEQSIEFQEDLM